jgi:hypothetical protein
VQAHFDHDDPNRKDPIDGFIVIQPRNLHAQHQNTSELWISTESNPKPHIQLDEGAELFRVARTLKADNHHPIVLHYNLAWRNTEWRLKQLEDDLAKKQELEKQVLELQESQKLMMEEIAKLKDGSKSRRQQNGTTHDATFSSEEEDSDDEENGSSSSEEDEDHHHLRRKAGGKTVDARRRTSRNGRKSGDTGTGGAIPRRTPAKPLPEKEKPAPASRMAREKRKRASDVEDLNDASARKSNQLKRYKARESEMIDGVVTTGGKNHWSEAELDCMKQTLKSKLGSNWAAELGKITGKEREKLHQKISDDLKVKGFVRGPRAVEKKLRCDAEKLAAPQGRVPAATGSRAAAAALTVAAGGNRTSRDQNSPPERSPQSQHWLDLYWDKPPNTIPLLVEEDDKAEFFELMKAHKTYLLENHLEHKYEISGSKKQTIRLGPFDLKKDKSASICVRYDKRQNSNDFEVTINLLHPKNQQLHPVWRVAHRFKTWSEFLNGTAYLNLVSNEILFMFVCI